MTVKNVYIASDIEGVAGVVFYEHRHTQMSFLNYDVLKRNRRLLTAEINAAAEGAFNAGAEKVIIEDTHGAGYNIFPESFDPRAELIHSRYEQGFPEGLYHPGLDGATGALVLIGMHAKAGTVHGCTPHSLIHVMTAEGREYQLSEASVSMAYAGSFGVPSVFISGDEAVVEDARAHCPGMGANKAKKHYASQFAKTVSPSVSCERIRTGVESSLRNTAGIEPFVIHGPCTVQVSDRNPDARWPENPKQYQDFKTAFLKTLISLPWYKPVEEIDDGWRYPDRTQPSATANDIWNKRNFKV